MANEEKPRLVEVSVRGKTGRLVDLNVPPASPLPQPTILDKRSVTPQPPVEVVVDPNAVNVKKHTRAKPKKG